MSIKPRNQLPDDKIRIDLTGPQGNAFYLLGMATKLAPKLGKDPKPILDRMESGNYENLIRVFDKEFGEFVDLYR